jgi:uncharacterized protein involved in exopolysaccharide biosynthesis
MGTVFGVRWVREARIRRITLAVMAALFAILSLWPRLYLARAQLVPNSSGGGLASLLGAASGGGLLTSLLGQEGPSIDVDLAAARSQTVAVDVVSQLRREGRLQTDDIAKAASVLRHKADIEAIRGNILQISVKDHRPDYAKAVVEAYVVSLRSHMTDLGLHQAGEKRVVAENRLGDAALQLSRAETALDQFRETNKLAAPEAQLGPAIALVTSLQANLQAEETSLQSQLQFATNDNIQVQAARARIAALKTQIADAQAHAQSSGAGPTLGGMTPQLNEYENLYRAAEFAEAEYEIYKRYLETVTVQELSSSINMDVIEPPYLSPERQLNISPFGALILVIVLFFLAEFYLANSSRAAVG